MKIKGLILHNLKNVYLSLNEKNFEEEIGFTKFYELHPKECVTVNGHGIHSVCVYAPITKMLNSCCREYIYACHTKNSY